jgi:hypothetical protein
MGAHETDTHFPSKAAKTGNIYFLQYGNKRKHRCFELVDKNGCPWDRSVFTVSALHGNIDSFM